MSSLLTVLPLRRSCRVLLFVNRRLFASDGGEFKSILPDSGIRSPFADPTRNRVVKAIALDSPSSTRVLTEIPKVIEKAERTFSDARTTPPIVPSPKETKKDTFSSSSSSDATASEIEEQLRLAKALPKMSLHRRIMDRFGLSIDQSLPDDEKRRLRMARNTKIGALFVFSWGLASFIVFCFYYGRVERDSEGNPIKDEYSGTFLAPFYRIVKSMRSWRDYVVEPSRNLLLPDPLPAPYLQPKYTIVIEMKNVLVTPEWTYKTGYRFKKRPALDYFLDVIGYPNFEVVIYTSESSMSAPQVVESFDPKQRIMYKLYRDCTKYMDGHHVKDLSRLNRDLSKVIHIDFDPKSFQLNPENVLRVPKWEGDMNDTALVDLAELLKTIHLSDVDDVRPVLQDYSKYDDPAKEFRRRAIYLAEQELEQKKIQEQGEGSLLKRYSGRLFGFRRHAT